MTTSVRFETGERMTPRQRLWNVVLNLGLLFGLLSGAACWFALLAQR
jgi:lipoprotein signal peptidase